MPLLEMKHISKAFNGVYANEDISLSVDQGEIHALLGENGAGKTTLMNILFGLYMPDGGEIVWKGTKVHFKSPKEAIAAGIGMVQQHFSLVNRMTVLDNVILNLEGNAFVLKRPEAKKRLLELAGKYGLSVDPDALISDLTVGERQRVEIIKALYRNAELLILDEPTGVLTPQETAHFFEVLRKLREEGYGIIIITHRMSEILAISDRVTILRDGKKAADLVTAETDAAELSHYMIGRELSEERMTHGAPGKEPLLEVRGASVHRRHGKSFGPADLTVMKGEILGIAGVEGNGQKDLAELITGIRKLSSGSVVFEGEDISRLSVRERYRRGICYISDDRQTDSLVTDMSISDNLVLRDFGAEPFSKNGIIRKASLIENAAEKMKKYQIRASGRTGAATPVKLLSGGNQQKLIIARELADDAKLIVASQPTRGLDIGATEFVRRELSEARNAGKSVLLISADLEEIMALSDRIAVLFGGNVAGILDRKDATVQKLGLLMGGVTEHADGKEAAEGEV